MPKYAFRFPTKFTGNQLDNFIDEFYNFYSVNKENGDYKFDLSEVEWMSNEEMLVLTAIFKSLVEADVKFNVFFLKKGSTAQLDRRVANQIFQIWNVWKIYEIAPKGEFQRYFDIHDSIVERLAIRFNLKAPNSEIYDRYGITPFITLDSIANYDSRLIGQMLSKTYTLSEATNEILRLHNCQMPFENHTLSSIITKELYENFLDHVQESLFSSSVNFAFLSLSLVPKLRLDIGIQPLLAKNFAEESNPEFKSFFYDETAKNFKNKSLLQFSFLDFGPGIVSTLRDEYMFRKSANKPTQDAREFDSEVLKLAFEYDSSKDPIEKRYLDKTVIPRGLYDILSIVRRFNGLLVVRSNYGKIYFDFSKDSERFQDARSFGDSSKFFPGTLITIFLPERKSSDKFDSSQIVIPYIKQFSVKEKLTPNYINIYQCLKSIDDGKLGKGEVYSKLFDVLVKEITRGKNYGARIHYFDFGGYFFDERITKKIIHFLVSDYNINSGNNIVVLNPPPEEFLDNVNNEILQLNMHVDSYRLHPIPFIREKDGGVDIFWMGVYNGSDAEKLKDLLLDQHDLRKSDFQDPGHVVGNVNFYDQHGNMHSYIDVESIVSYFQKKGEESSGESVRSIISKYIIKRHETIFLCPGNYYQNEYLQLYDAINNAEECKLLADALLVEIKRHVKIDETLKFICVTSSSQQIVKYFEFEEEPQIISLDNYHSIMYDTTLAGLVKDGDRVILICDVFSTGFLTNIICSRLNEIGAFLEKIAVLVDATDENFEPENQAAAIREKVVSVLRLKMVKYRRKDIGEKLVGNQVKVVRINPYTNTPIMESLSSNPMNDRVLMDNEEFMDIIDESHVKAGYFKFNNLIHPYFFDMEEILKNPTTAKKLLQRLFEKFQQRISFAFEVIFFPKGSAIQQLNFEDLKTEIFKNHSIAIAELQRFSTNEGWRFPHPPKFMHGLAKGKRALIIDDGSCSGDSLMQMIDEIASLEVKEIFVLSIIGRLNDHKKDFFTRLSTISGNSTVIPVYVYFGVQWHIPTYYIEESPIIREKQWLESVSAIPNLPGKIKLTAENILSELSLKNVKDSSNRYLLKRKDNVSIIKELILVKEEIGKVTSYKYYTEYFEYFNRFIRQYEGSTVVKDRYRMIESICAVFLHEPDLYNKVRTILPDLTEKIEVFVQTILFGNPERNKNRLSKDDLFYKWSNKNIIHLFFIVYRGESLFNILSTGNMAILIRDFATAESDLHYLFYRILKYLPITETDLNKKPFTGRAKHLIEVLKESVELKGEVKRHLKRFSTFLSSLPSSQENFLETLANMKLAYVRISDDAFHNEYIFNDKQIVGNQLRLLAKYKKEGKSISSIVDIVRSKWEAISVFVSKLLSFYKSHSNFFFVHNFITDAPNGKKSLAGLVGIVDEAIYNEEFSDVEILIEAMNEIFNEFILEESFLYKLFSSITVQTVSHDFEKFIADVSSTYPKFEIMVNPGVPKASVNIPLFYLTEIIFKELKSNFRYVDECSPLIFSWHEDSKNVTLTISNKAKPSLETGGGQGLAKLNLFNNFPIPTTYSSFFNKWNTEFVQSIQLSKI